MVMAIWRHAATSVAAVAVGAMALGAPAAHAGDVAGPRLIVHAVSRNDVPGYTVFRYHAGRVTGMGATADQRATGIVQRIVQHTLDTVQGPGEPCSGGASTCGYLIQRLTQRPCTIAAICIAQVVGDRPPGANDGEEWVQTVALDSAGRQLRLVDVVPAGRMPAVLASIAASLRRTLATGGVSDLADWPVTVTRGDLHAWLPEPDGLHVWFAKFAVAPGSFGTVHVVVPWGVAER